MFPFISSVSTDWGSWRECDVAPLVSSALRRNSDNLNRCRCRLEGLEMVCGIRALFFSLTCNVLPSRSFPEAIVTSARNGDDGGEIPDLFCYFIRVSLEIKRGSHRSCANETQLSFP
jgi:hypothetical protein